ncbi:hypothetical protein FGSG_10550 [Fusarium graminearum PH-1]|uniref:Chromosome 1, complete genome n=1 Tax=Gibberella zeae (strain ATCC MYA-4620 / CBS 123657 / FGSC 9075 / NRRL 31084 / PH-1) TaxID=229533 RepID=I1S1E9_GIBZE|nr:hypothetical protein FGSG_10550 [Fusarium graminearum PH-1]ESU17286.1 hypothetical protein FGSG_10550 [Fusarium graminearum PH-1]CEF75997.1 unnamed protein product [Fusarium graminearum]|eukprot:XP_011319548.1 hypothetical protein FGSG_10550 [Fusarium graminearum PH-1]
MREVRPNETDSRSSQSVSAILLVDSMLTQTRLNVSPSGQLIFYRPNPLPKYPLLDRPIPWPKLCCHNDTSILKAPELNANVPLLQLPDELLQSILRSVVQKPLEFALGYDAYWDVYWDSITEDDVPNWGPEKGWARQASFTKLQFYNLHARPESVKVFLEWPKELHEFTITLAGNTEYHEPNPAFRWNHNRLADVLSSQKDYLRVLDVGWLGHDRDQNGFPVSTFQNLHTMALCIAYKKPSEESCQNWLTPSLHTLILDLHDSGQCGPSSFRCMDKGNAQRIIEETMLGGRRMNLIDFGLIRIAKPGLSNGFLVDYAYLHSIYDVLCL